MSLSVRLLGNWWSHGRAGRMELGLPPARRSFLHEGTRMKPPTAGLTARRPSPIRRLCPALIAAGLLLGAGLASAAEATLADLFTTLEWITLAPTSFDPTRGIYPAEASLAEDLRVLCRTRDRNWLRPSRASRRRRGSRSQRANVSIRTWPTPHSRRWAMPSCPSPIRSGTRFGIQIWPRSGLLISFSPCGSLPVPQHQAQRFPLPVHAIAAACPARHLPVWSIISGRHQPHPLMPHRPSPPRLRP
jgi:hypothetical protein